MVLELAVGPTIPCVFALLSMIMSGPPLSHGQEHDVQMAAYINLSVASILIQIIFC